MPTILRHVWEFLVAVLRQWAALVTGGLIVAVIGLYEHATGRQFAGRFFWIAVIISLVVAFFLVWRKERLEVERLTRRRGKVRDHLSGSLKVIDKFVRVLNDPDQVIPIDRINEWEVETCIYLRENVSEAAENLFMSETGAPPPPTYKFIQERAEPLQKLHYRSFQLHKILDQLGLE
jgi:hypothetical protein